MNYQQCPICDKEFKVCPCKKRTHCSVACMKEGYKTQLAGENNPNYKGKSKKHCEICKIEISRNAKSRCVKCKQLGKDNSFLGKTHSEETKKIWSEKRKGRDLGNWTGRKHKDESKGKISKAHKEKWLSLTEEEKKSYTDVLFKGLQTQLSYAETKPEKMVRDILDEHKITYEKNKSLYGKFLVDFYVGDGKVIIEVFGDYWHANPSIFATPNGHQEKQMAKDKSRLAYLRKCGHEVIVVWEDDLKTKKSEVVDRLTEVFGRYEQDE